MFLEFALFACFALPAGMLAVDLLTSPKHRG